ncbi:hypothetical protein BCR33DRAFT_173016 [Rhizoclosmatium globosum]|uniref:TFIIS central domain-containing protein n=1 Tax=Rhizoclosmatium globosum TaxID=329046 RepID=A0A1Y2CFK3_9FUNG|nr:hypothetical protein BCR33DRAFT_173016 [Rhizoclosmatium globosum]|eukprot:ORY45706.1 hypothetical protein BCR33DRAFT_173016 [Rhizoclosmatium globosum]
MARRGLVGLNSTLRIRLLTGALATTTLVKLEARELANDEIRKRTEEIRTWSLRDAMKPKDVEIMYKKTHKGDEEIRASVEERREEVVVVRKRDVDVSEDEMDTSVAEASSSTGIRSFPVGIAKIVAEAEAAARAPVKIVAPTAKIESLDDLLAKVGGSPTAGLKRRGSEDDYSDSSKKGRVDEASSGVAAATSSWENLGVSDSWASFDGGLDGDDSWMREGLDLEGVTSTTSTLYSPHTPEGSPPPMEPPVVWTGSVRMPQVAKFMGTCRQIAGRPVGDSVKQWEDLLPPSVFVEGRIDIARTQGYIDQQKLSTSKEVIAVEFIPENNGGDLEMAVSGTGEGGFQELCNYFLEKKRYAVVGSRYVSVRDMYLVPVRAGESVPSTIAVLSKFCVSDKTDARDRLFGVMILDKAFFSGKEASNSSNNKRPATSVPSSNGSSNKRPAPTPAPVPTAAAIRKEPARDPRIRQTASTTTTTTQPPPITTTAWPGLSTHAQTQQPYAPALPLGTPAVAPSATALALLMQLQRQQQAATPAPVAVPQGIAGLLSQIQAANALQAQQQKQQSYSASSGLYGTGNR